MLHFLNASLYALFTMHDTGKLYQLTFDEHPGYLYAHIKADIMTTEMSAAYLSEIVDKCAGLGLTKVLIYREVPYMDDSAVSIYYSMQDEIELLKGLQLAIVTPFPETEEGLRFAILVSNNRGANFELHPTVEAAKAWLSR
jgi:hypothetical protein